MAIDIDNLTYLARIDPVVLKDILTELDERIIKLECENKEILSKMKELQSQGKVNDLSLTKGNIK